jgi:membrane associated rhomboid family serine protease
MPLFTVALILANVAAYSLELGAGGLPACEVYGLVPRSFMSTGALSPLISSLFLHDPGALTHIVGNMAFLAIFGTLVEGRLGHLRFLALYLAAGVFGGLAHVLVAPGSTDPLVGASGAIFGVLAVAGALYPRLLGFVAAFAGLNIWNAFTGGSGNVSFGCHIGGFVIGFLAVVLLRATDSEALEAA